ncbi:transcriptional repressor general negative regulator of transcription subunit 4 [Parahypoxylon ruwenzoriense]
MAPQDSFIDDEEDTCPLCIEEFDLSDRNFRPCPCGYQICQFCYNNLKNNLNGLCPACRRPYDEKDIKWKVITHEEEAEFRANIQKNQKKRASEQRQKEAQKREAEKESRKNLQGVRVVQKNLVYVTGLTPTVREDELLKTLRKPEFFGQYGNIQKISISNRKSADGQPQSLGIYVTFEKKEDAARCIQAVHGSQNGDRILKAQLGTTKYCSAWLRHEQCGNRQCMFLHELGDEEDSYSRQDLSSLNSVHTQRPLSNAASSSRSASRQQSHPIPGSQSMVRTSSKEGSDAGDGPALPASANWARTTQQRSRRGSHATSGAASSPAISTSLPVTAESAQEATETAAVTTEVPTPASRKAEKQPATDTPAKPAPVSSKVTPGTRRDVFDFTAIMKILAACPASAFVPSKDTGDSYPPLFDINGAERRRAMRDEEENRLGDHEEQAENLEPSEGEPESGSLALGGEPEDRDQGRDGGRYDQRRNPAQPPIQRTNANELFGPSLSVYGQSSAAVGSIGGRTMTPQQQLFIRPQGSFADQMPPGISQPSSLFQGQGHTRQQSRFSFANENSSSSINVKSTGDPRYMAQQSSMMPSAYRSQPGNQLYPSSMPGPPPGLKSAGTTPVNGGMFGQGHSFGGSAFGAASKDTSSELLQSIIRGRGAGSSQAHDAAKREYFSSFHNQYPPSTSSTPAPAPAPGLLASLYGTQPGAFQDFGPKQKKKGKKHRHANTSSSGGSGLVDLADPSILQARIPHQQQGNGTGVGQGLYGGQTQDDDLIPFDEASSSVDALVADSYGPEEPQPSSFIPEGGRTSVPPGLGLSHSHPPAQFAERSSTPAPQSQVGQIRASSRSPAILRPVTPLVLKYPVKPAASGKKEIIATSGNEAKKSIKELAAKSGLSKDIAAQASKSTKGKGVLDEEDFPALDSVKTSSPPKVTPVLPSKPPSSSTKAPQGKKSASETAGKPPSGKVITATPSKSEKRPVPGILDIAAATKTVARASVSETTSGTDKLSNQVHISASQTHKAQGASALPTPTPTTASVSSPITKVAPKTLRLVHTPKAEAPPIHIPPAAVASIRAASIIAGSANRPATPASEGISDTASIVSASVSVSRTSSPPPSKVGSASMRVTTKSQQRKQRKEASKEAAAQLTESKPVEQEVEIAPILGRKKKQKKERKTTTTSRPETPSVAEPQADIPVSQKGTATPPTDLGDKSVKGAKNSAPVDESPRTGEQKAKPAKSPARSPTTIDTSIRLNESTKTTVLTPDYVGHTPELKPEQPVDEDIGDIPNLRDVFRAVVEDSSLPDAEVIGFFKTAQGYRSDSTTNIPTSLPPTLKAIVTKEDEDKLNAFLPVRKIVNEHTVLLTPNGDCLLNLTQDEADLFLELQDRLRADSIRPTAFSAPRYAPATGFSLVKNRAVPNGTPSYFPSGPDNYPSDPVGKMHREEAISCINQHVLPSLNVNGYKAMGPNSNSGKNVNLQQLAPWICPSVENAEDQRKMFSGRAGDEFSHGSAGNSTADSVYSGYDNPNGGPSPSIGSTPLMSVEDAETAWGQAKKQHEALDKKFRQLQAKNRRLVGLH